MNSVYQIILTRNTRKNFRHFFTLSGLIRMCADSYTQTNPLERKSQRTTSLQLEPAKTFAQLRIIINSINGYLLIGILGAVLLAMTEILQKFLYHPDTGAINFAGGTAEGFHDFLYFSFITLTTLGYGDVTPVSAFAKSVTLMIAVTGQLYLTVLIAMLVGKFLSKTETD